MIKINYPSDSDEFHRKYILALGITDISRNRFLKFLQRPNFAACTFNLDFILLAKFEDLLKISYSLNLTNHEEKWLKYFFNYDNVSTNKFQPKIKSFFENELKIKTCYFCNIDFVNSFNDRNDYHDFIDFIQRAEKEDLVKLKGIGEKKATKIISERNDIDNSKIIQKLINDNRSINLEDKYSHFTLDHVLDKASHPLLALSLYNFVPSCYSCNSKFKGSKQFINDDSMSYLSPTSDNFSFNVDVKFKLYFHNGKDTSTIEAKNDFILDFSYARNQDAYKKYIDIFKLKGRYIFHKDEVINLINKKERYSQSQIDDISKAITITSEQIKKDIFGKELFERDIENISMTKFKQDIARDIELID